MNEREGGGRRINPPRRLVAKAMLDDVVIEANGEIADNKGTRKAIGRRAVCLFKEYLNKTT